MPLRTSWEGYLKVSLISVPVKAYSASVSGRRRIFMGLRDDKPARAVKRERAVPIKAS